MYPCFIKFCSLFIINSSLLDTLSPQFSLLRHWHNAFQLNPLSWSWTYDSLKALNLVSMEDEVKLSTRKRRLSSLSLCLCVVEHSHVDGLARFTRSDYHFFGGFSFYGKNIIRKDIVNILSGVHKLSCGEKVWAKDCLELRCLSPNYHTSSLVGNVIFCEYPDVVQYNLLVC